MNSLSRILVLAQNTFREAVRDRLLYNLLLFATLMIASSIVLAKLHIGYDERIYRDVGLGAISFFGVLIAVFVGINLVYREISLKTVYSMLAKPVRRWEFLVGKYLGLMVLLVVEIGVMSALFFGVLWYKGSDILPGMFWAIEMILLELALITAVAIFFSSFTTPYLAGMFTVALWIIGHLLADVRAFGLQPGSGIDSLADRRPVLGAAQPGSARHQGPSGQRRYDRAGARGPVDALRDSVLGGAPGGGRAALPPPGLPLTRRYREAVTEVPLAFAIGFSAALGSVIGSFLNVVIHRLPRNESLVHPRSRCPKCGDQIPGWLNVPILSWIALRGRCRCCKAPISPRYPAVEALTALLFVALALLEPLGARLVAHWALAAALVAVTFIDLEHQIIPNSITFPGIALGLALSFVAPPPGWLDAGLGVVVGGGLMWAVSAFYEWRTGQIGLGMGDVKLVAMLGAFLGVEAALGIMVLSSLLGLVYGLGYIATHGGGRRTRIPFGPALAVAGLVHLFVPDLLARATSMVAGA